MSCVARYSQDDQQLRRCEVAGSDPLSRYPAICTSRLDEFEYQLKSIYGATGFDVRDASSLNVRGSFIKLHDTALGFGACGTAAQISFDENDFSRLQIPLSGRGITRCGKSSTEVGVGRPSLTTAGRDTVLHYGADFEHLFLRVGAEALERKLAALVGRPVQRRLEFELADFASPAMLTGLLRMIERLATHLDDQKSQLSALTVREMEQAIVVQLLLASRHNMSFLLDQNARDGAPDHVRRVEAYIEARWDHPLTIEDLVAVSGVSARTLFKAFEKRRGCSPMAFAKKIRLDRSHDLLRKPDGETSVGGVALRCGFSNLGHFARDYRKTFGESPSQTLVRSKARW